MLKLMTLYTVKVTSSKELTELERKGLEHGLNVSSER